jgi:DNA-directed RNA polymerase subunit K/omega
MFFITLIKNINRYIRLNYPTAKLFIITMSDYESESAASSDSESSIVEKSVTKPKSKTIQKNYILGEEEEEEEEENASGSESGSEMGVAAGSDDEEVDLDELPSDDELFREHEAEGNENKPKQSEKKAKRPNKKAAAEAAAAAFTDELEKEYFEESDYSEDEDDEDAYGEEYLQKFDDTIRDAILENHHQDLLHHNYVEVEALTVVVRDERGIIIDPLHRTMPMLTKYEKARVLGERAKQINGGAKPFVKVREGVIDGYLIACDELEQKKMPFIIRRPINGGFEYWRMKDLEVLF